MVSHRACVRALCVRARVLRTSIYLYIVLSLSLSLSLSEYIYIYIYTVIRVLVKSVM